jgi:hypothetical protein
MLVVETIARIRREHFIKGRTIKEIVRDMKVSRNTVWKVGSASVFPAPMTARARNAQPPRWQACGAFRFGRCFGSW